MLKTIIICDKCGKKCKDNGTFLKLETYRRDVSNPDADIDLDRCWGGEICEECYKVVMSSLKNKLIIKK